MTWFERLFFDDWDRLEAAIWVLSHVLILASDRDASAAMARSTESDALFRGSILMHVAYQWGLPVIESMLGTSRGQLGDSTSA